MLEWFFDGIGTELVSLGVGLLTGGFAGYRIGVYSKSRQEQKAGDSARQRQTFQAKAKFGDSKSQKLSTKITQSQVAGDNSTQVQSGGICDDE